MYDAGNQLHVSQMCIISYCPMRFIHRHPSLLVCEATSVPCEVSTYAWVGFWVLQPNPWSLYLSCYRTHCLHYWSFTTSWFESPLHLILQKCLMFQALCNSTHLLRPTCETPLKNSAGILIELQRRCKLIWGGGNLHSSQYLGDLPVNMVHLSIYLGFF